LAVQLSSPGYHITSADGIGRVRVRCDGEWMHEEKTGVSVEDAGYRVESKSRRTAGGSRRTANGRERGGERILLQVL